MKCLVAGGGGFIGGHLVKELLERGQEVRVADIKPLEEWWQLHADADNLVLDLSLRDAARRACSGMDRVYMLACDMGGIGFIETNKARCMLSSLITTHMLQAAHYMGVKRYFYSSSACVYPAAKQNATDLPALREDDAYPAMPEDGYGWEKLFGERMARHFFEDYGLEVRIARFHNIYGPHGSYDGGREKAPAAICRKVIEAKRNGTNTIEIWGDGRQVRSFCWIEDCIKGILRLMESDYREPLNIGSSESVTIDQLVDIVEIIAGAKLQRRYHLGAPKGVSGRNSDNTRIEQVLGWEPTTALRVGMTQTYQWIEKQ